MSPEEVYIELFGKLDGEMTGELGYGIGAITDTVGVLLTSNPR